ncbi:MAG: hypothetical protein JXB13_17685 [Phycisphaerae bacterium]|nr:hypothetical protein [Phycisphaerae bacterium]
MSHALTPIGPNIRIILGLSLATLTAAGGCRTTRAGHETRMGEGCLFYCDGAGGDSALHNWSDGVRKGMKQAGYPGTGKVFRWQTGPGAAADQATSVDYKRRKAGELATKIQQRARAHPGAPITLMGLSAGTAICVYALEALPEEVSVRDVFLFAGSLSSTYDLTAALKRVERHMFVFSSDNDAVLRFLVPLGGTADREPPATGTIRADGVRQPPSAGAETRRQYAKIIDVPWEAAFTQYGYHGGHTDALNARFVQAVVAPLVMGKALRGGAEARFSADQVPNPDYERWATFPPGTWTLLEGFHIQEDWREPVRIRETLVSVEPDKLMLERTFVLVNREETTAPVHRLFVVMARIDPDEHPFTAPDSTLTQGPDEQPLSIGDQTYPCRVRTLRAKGTYEEWGTAPTATVYTNPDVPGGIVRIDLITRTEGREARYLGQVTQVHPAP